MAPTMTQAAKESFKPDWHLSSLHEKLISPGPKEEKINAYGEWAETYDKDVRDHDYCAPETVSKILIDEIAKSPSMSGKKSVLLLDAGCGTGLTGEAFLRCTKDMDHSWTLIGLDYSPAMLELADKKGIYDTLRTADLNEPLPLNGQKVDLITATGVFMEGHCGPRALGNLLSSLVSGGCACLTVRNESFKPKEDEYNEVIKSMNCVVESNDILPYLGPVVANYLTICKM